MNRPNRSPNPGSIRGADALMTQADTQDRKARPIPPYDIDGNSSFSGRAGTGRQDDVCRSEFLDLVEQWPVVATDKRLVAEFAAVASQVVDERVVVVDDQNHVFISVTPSIDGRQSPFA